MPQNQRSFVKRRLVDTAGFLLIALGVLFGWVPGPGGIPLVFAGLALLATNHAWAERWLAYLKHHGGNLVNVFFPSNKWVQLLYDLTAIAMVVLAIVLINDVSKVWTRNSLIILGVCGLSVLFINRRRAERLGRYLRSLVRS